MTPCPASMAQLCLQLENSGLLHLGGVWWCLLSSVFVGQSVNSSSEQRLRWFLVPGKTEVCSSFRRSRHCLCVGSAGAFLCTVKPAALLWHQWQWILLTSYLSTSICRETPPVSPGTDVPWGYPVKQHCGGGDRLIACLLCWMVIFTLDHVLYCIWSP